MSLYIPDFRDLQRLADGRWAATHQGTGRTVEADTLRELVYIKTTAVRIASEWREPAEEGSA